ncbi:hydrogenase-2 assembly chaperone [Kosakonia oryzendophytica]|uniref:hydrogenase-2 assembly chaperone n=1 Tax=Kosakonia TaxID=1330547 RepID=UPI0021D9024A|nr:hydrogenase-2 assembly chaperone [Kosakonia sp. ML.JS2a]UXY11658.1 hydrogenase-2 assembly chaperone [Kosakonia sp. ML.JS2a]
MQDELTGFDASPHGEVQAAFAAVAAGEMHDLPFVHPHMPISVTPFTLFEGQWIGCVITPWMLSLLIFPGPQQCWVRRNVGERIGLRLPYGEMTFTVGEMPALAQYLSCSLMSPLARELRAEQGASLAHDCLKMALSLPVSESVSRRALLTRLKDARHA